MIHPDTELKFISPEIGYGVVATKFIPKGTITWIMDPLDQVFKPDEIKKLDTVFQAILNKYCYRDPNGSYVLCWDDARFVNHSFNSSCMSTAYNFELAIRDIHPGEELTDDYGYLNIWEPFDCLPEPGITRTRVMPDDLLHFHKQWDASLISAFKEFNRVPQPFSSLIDKQYAEKVRQVAAGAVEMDSILKCYYGGKEAAFTMH